MIAFFILLAYLPITSITSQIRHSQSVVRHCPVLQFQSPHIILIATTPTELQELLNRVADSGKRYGLVINKGKTKLMTTEGDNSVDITIDEDVLQQVDHFQYLGNQ